MLIRPSNNQKTEIPSSLCSGPKTKFSHLRKVVGTYSISQKVVHVYKCSQQTMCNPFKISSIVNTYMQKTISPPNTNRQLLWNCSMLRTTLLGTGATDLGTLNLLKLKNSVHGFTPSLVFVIHSLAFTLASDIDIL